MAGKIPVFPDPEDPYSGGDHEGASCIVIAVFVGLLFVFFFLVPALPDISHPL